VRVKLSVKGNDALQEHGSPASVTYTICLIQVVELFL
jgi:hypothetical protein